MDVIIDNIDVHPTNAAVFNTPIVVFKNNVYFVTVESPKNKTDFNEYNLLTVVYKINLQNNIIDKKIIDSNTIEDRWHTQPSIGIDEEGYIHIAYNMHNMPWQYVISKNPEDISEFEFKGQKISIEDIKKVKKENKTNFQTIGEGVIPGNQITYPAFFNDKFRGLYITYRYKLKPSRKWDDRASAGGVAKYDSKKKKWMAIGGPVRISDEDVVLTNKADVPVSDPFLYSDSHEPYLIQLAFDSANNIHASWLWREGGAGPDCSNPSYLKLTNETKLPISFNYKNFIDSSERKYYAPSSITVDKNNNVWVINCPVNETREVININKSKKYKTPSGANIILSDKYGNKFYFASGPRIYIDMFYSSFQVKNIYTGYGGKYLKVVYDNHSSSFYIYMHKDKHTVQILKFYKVY